MHTRARKLRGIRLLAALSGAVLVGAVTPSADAATAREDQWHLDAMHADEMWKTSTGKGVTVAVVDSGVDPRLPDLRGRVLPGKDLSWRPGDEHTDYDGHGTGMAALIAGTGAAGAQNGTYGLAPGAKILPIRIPDFIENARKDGNPDSYPTFISKAIRYAADSDAQIINISQASEWNSPELAKAVEYALSKNKLIFAGVGNLGRGTNPLQYPAATPGVVGVGAIGKDLKKTAASQRGPQVDLVAPGDEMVAACSDAKSGVCVTSGTSDATAIASASAALIWSKHPTWTNNQVLRVLVNTASGPVSGKKRTDEIGYGAVRPRIALTKPGDPGPADEYPLPGFPAKGSAAPSPAVSAGARAGQADDSGTLLGVVIGAGGVALLGGAVVWVVVRRRRRSGPPTHTAAAFGGQVQGPYPPHPPYGAAPQGGPTSPYGQGPTDQQRPL
ncbi:type VII secretion-associated serine protease mycosin [Streptomyces sp. NPDC059524]|uniref:type VII secretion-associated serine protease mycosin n=1 Tax=Streptomyces sp. NPDC059524 TaxID=3346856 RepID=UPI0036D18F7B